MDGEECCPIWAMHSVAATLIFQVSKMHLMLLNSLGLSVFQNNVALVQEKHRSSKSVAGGGLWNSARIVPSSGMIICFYIVGFKGKFLLSL